MATNLRPIPPPLGEKILDESGIVTAVWGDFFSNIYRFQKLIDTSESDGTFTLGTGSVDGEITIVSGVITSITEVVP